MGSRLIQRRDWVWPVYVPCPAETPAALKQELLGLQRVVLNTLRRCSRGFVGRRLCFDAMAVPAVWGSPPRPVKAFERRSVLHRIVLVALHWGVRSHYPPPLIGTHRHVSGYM